jgi:hypothetical protein
MLALIRRKQISMARPDFLTRMFLRDYAIVERTPGVRSHRAVHSLALIATSAWLFAACLAAWCVFCAISAPVLPEWIPLWSAPRWSALAQISLIAFAPSTMLDRKMRPYEAQRTTLVDVYSTPRERMIWWWTTASIAPLTGLVAVCFMSAG